MWKGNKVNNYRGQGEFEEKLQKGTKVEVGKKELSCWRF